MNQVTTPASMWAPLSSPLYAMLFTATVISNIGTWMHEVGASWLMTEMTQDPAKVALIQTAVSLPIFLFALPAGALADLMDRRKLLIAINAVACLLALGLAVTIEFGFVGPWILIAFTFSLGVSAAFIAPAWQAIVPGLVNKSQLSAAVSLNGVGINISRAIGPAVAGALIVSSGIETPFWVNSVSYLFIISALLWWRPNETAHQGLPKEHILPAMISGLRYARHSKPLINTLVRALAFFIAASAFWALLPIIVNVEMEGQASLYGLATGLVGAGALAGAFALPKLKAHFSPSTLLLVVSLLDATLFIALSLTFNQGVLLVCCFLFGGAWIIALANLNVSAQTSLPNWVRARGLSVFLTVFFGAMSLGSVVWGNIASVLPLTDTLLIASFVLVLGGLATTGIKLNLGTEQDLEPSLHWATPQIDKSLSDQSNVEDRGPVMVTIEYLVDDADWTAFNEAIVQLGEARKRYGAYQWGVVQDTSHPQRFVEYFFESSWLHHLHHHERTAGEDREKQRLVNAFHSANTSPLVQHMLAVPIKK